MTSSGEQSPSVILTVAPQVGDETYREHFEALIAFLGRLMAAADRGDTVLTIVDQATREAVGDRLPSTHLIPGEVADVWVRDFGAVPVRGDLVQFIYRPSYHPPPFADRVRTTWAQFLGEAGIAVRPVDLVLDGGNVVYDRTGSAIVTERVLSENPGRSKEEIRQLLLNEAGYSRAAIVPEGPREKTGHADGLVSWLAPNVVGIARLEEPYRRRISESLVEQLPGLRLVELPNVPSGVTWRGWQSCSGIYANSLVTRNAHYVPQFGLDDDERALAIYDEHGDRPVVAVKTGDEVQLGGTIRCLTLELEGAAAQRILSLREPRGDEEGGIS
jgi:agmatine/peptidylarginine deiminase